ncbi:MAG: hypothetical protein R2774_08575 [Saprospiraceae bacterium]
MKSHLLLFLAFVGILTQMSCLNDSCTNERTFVQYNPVFLSRAEFEKPNVLSDLRPLKNPGKMYFYQNFLFINEKGLGVHVFDLSDYTNPINIAFYDIPGNFDIAIKDHYLYADNVIDLITIDIVDLANPKIINRNKDYLKLHQNTSDQRYYAYSLRTNITQILSCDNPNIDRTWFILDGVEFLNSDISAGVVNTNQSSTFSGTGISGSFARFTVVENNLYVVNNSSIIDFDLTLPATPELKYEKPLGWGIETLFPYKDKLFIGSTSGMFIFNRASDGYLSLASNFSHARACDPVVVQDDIAYITLRNGTKCQGFSNQLEVVDVNNVFKPILLNTFKMRHPHGLSVYGDHLYVAEGNFGFTVLNVATSKDIKEVARVTNLHAYDMISLDEKTLFVVGDDGFYLYDVQKSSAPRLVSSIKTEI